MGLAEPAGASVLEIGGGVGALQIEALRRGAVTATNLELSPTYEAEAAALLAEYAVADRAHRVVADLIEQPASAPDADVVLLHRVVCCTADPAALLGASAGHARRRLVLSFPRDTWWLRAAVRFVNTGAALSRWQWRFHVHRPADLVAAVERHGLRLSGTDRRRVWELAVLDRPAG